MRPPSRSVQHASTTALLGAFVGLLLALTLAGFVGGWSWLADLCEQFRLHLAAFLVVMAILAAAVRRFKIASAALVGVVVNAAVVLPLYIPQAAPTQPVRVTLRLLHLNVDLDNPDLRPTAEYVSRSNADVVVLQEVEDAWVRSLPPLMPDFDLVTSPVPAENYGTMLLLRKDDGRRLKIHHLRQFNPRHLSENFWLLETIVRVEGVDVVISGVQTFPPIDADHAAERNGQLLYAAEWASEQALPHVIIGDLNVTPWSWWFRETLDRGELVNSGQGFGLQSTWPSGQGSLLMLPIDHCLHSSDIVTLDREIGPDLGSDHRPLLVTLGVLKP